MFRPISLAITVVLLATTGALVWFRAPETAPAGRSGNRDLDQTQRPEPRSATTPWSSARSEEVRVSADPLTGVIHRTDLRHAAGRRTPVAVEPIDAGGIRCPDGRHLPLLNGVSAAPAILRDPMLGPVPPVVAVVVDSDGWEWYEHADRSSTTCRPAFVAGADGVPTMQVVTLHNTPQAGDGPIQPLPEAASRAPTDPRIEGNRRP